MAIASVFKSNQSQAVRIPVSDRFPESVKKVEIISIGRSRLITPVEDSWDAWFDGEGVSEDFMLEREQPEEQVRESL
ncbi:type II toxin-antitoxin system VapB family antitoxin [Salinibius halmophilus]|uniref:type II toxin-antitoxin system VapB family antitoxin n=1 Tax=Salinibius halmophilus TaxID=1853216 RepID=UPI000E66FF78|nr:type II toxin-antitoxin system VapB family antitoxin [Salinibius halmophilus]